MITQNVSSQSYKSRRGDYRMITFSGSSHEVSSLVWIPTPLGDTKRDKDVIAEIQYAREYRLDEHPYWKDEPIDFIDHYARFYRELFRLEWLHEKEDRHNVVVDPVCCLTLVQYNNGVLHAYSRSTDMRNGYFSDRLILNYLAATINKNRPDCKVEQIRWYLAIPHVYVKEGIARLLEEER